MLRLAGKSLTTMHKIYLKSSFRCSQIHGKRIEDYEDLIFKEFRNFVKDVDADWIRFVSSTLPSPISNISTSTSPMSSAPQTQKTTNISTSKNDVHACVHNSDQIETKNIDVRSFVTNVKVRLNSKDEFLS